MGMEQRAGIGQRKKELESLYVLCPPCPRGDRFQGRSSLKLEWKRL